MKKMVSWVSMCLTVVMIVLSLLAGGCARPAKEAVTPSPAEKVTPTAPVTTTKEKVGREAWPKALSVSIRAVGSGGYFVGAGLTTILEKYLGMPVTGEPSAGSTGTAMLLASGDVELGNVAALDAYTGYRGQAPFAKKVPMRAFAAGIASDVSYLVRADSKIMSVPDLRGKRIMRDFKGSTITQTISRVILEAYGMTLEDVKSMPYTAMGDASAALVEGLADAIVIPIGVGSAVVKELETKVALRELRLGEKETNYLMEKVPYMALVPRKVGDYKYVTQDYLVPHILDFFVAHRDLPDDLVYEVTKALYDHLEEFHKTHPRAQLYTREAATGGVKTMAYHPGAIKYFKEKGLWTAEHDQIQKKVLAEIGAER